MDRIPSVDLKNFLSNDPTRKQKFINEIGKAYEDIGFVALKGHFLDDELVDNLYEEIKNFFSLPIATKHSYVIEGIGGQRGYVSFGKESAKGKKEGDLKEFWHFGQYGVDDDERRKEYPENVDVKELPKFNAIGKKTYAKLEETAKYVLRALALYVGLEETYFDN
jgi:isopenicillin N synthase-like dioxygenase